MRVVQALDEGDESVMVKTTVGCLIFNEQLPLELRSYGREAAGGWRLGSVMNKKALGRLVAQCYDTFGATRTAEVIDSVKRLGYHFACLAGMTVSVSDCVVPPAKAEILAETAAKVKRVEQYYRRGILTEKERYDKVVMLWNEATERVADAMMANMDEFNPIFMMSDSGARGNKQQMRQLAGMRGLMADPSGKIIDLPITANFREGLSVSDYFISSHGARKGLADTALRTADSGYLTRRLVDVAQDVIVRGEDCDVTKINLTYLRALLAEDTGDAVAILSDILLGRTLARDVTDSEGTLALAKDSILNDAALEKLIDLETESLTLRGCSSISPLESPALTETVILGTRDKARRESVRRAFLTAQGGRVLAKPAADYPEGTVLNDSVLDDLLTRDDLDEIFIRLGRVRGIQVEAIREETISSDNTRGIIEPLKERILGRVLAEDIKGDDGKLIAKINDTVDAPLADKICAVRDKVLIRSVLTCRAGRGVCQKCYGRDLANSSQVEVGEAVGIIAAQSIGEPGTQLTMRTFHTGGVAGGDITQGLPRVEELFEARKPKNNAIIAEISGLVKEGSPDKNGLKTLIIEPFDKTNLQPREYTIPFGVLPRVKPGDKIQAGDNITDGPKNPHDILRICGIRETHRYLVKEVQKVYKSQGVEINDKHIEVMVRQMLHKVRAAKRGKRRKPPQFAIF